MTGIRQHILPRFLLKGFASQTQGDVVSTYVFRKEGTIFEANIANVGVEKYFYGRNEELNADDEITRLEGEYARLVDGLRTKEDGTEISDVAVHDFIAQLTVRTKHFRDSVLESSEFLFDQAISYLLDINNFKTMMLNHPELMKEELNSFIKSEAMPPGQAAAFRRRAEKLIPQAINEYGPQLQTMFQSYLLQIKAELPRIFKESHIQALKKEPTPHQRAEEYRKLRWFVFQSDDPFILGDHGCIFEAAGGKGFKAYDDKGDQILHVYLPISNFRMLIGTSFSSMPKVDSSNIRQSIARCSKDFFVCSTSTEDIRALLPLIGENAGLITREEQEQIILEVIQRGKSPRSVF